MVDTEIIPTRGLPNTILPPSPPGLEALYLACRRIYPDQPNPLQVAAVVKCWLGGPDPLDYISMYSNPGNQQLGIPPHWHYISFGLSDLHGDGRVHERSSSLTGPSGFGFELTFRLKCDIGETAPPTWPATLLQSLAKYVFNSGNAVCAGDHVSWHSALDGSESLIEHMLLDIDPQLGTVNTPCGTVDFIQIVGVCRSEMKAAQRWNGMGVLDLLKRIPNGGCGGAWLVTDMRRGESLFQLDPNSSHLIEVGIENDGSNLSGVTANCSWTENSENGACGGYESCSESEEVAKLFGNDKEPFSHGRNSLGLGNVFETTELLQTKMLDFVHLTFNLESGCLLPLAIRGRVKHGRHFTFKSATSANAITFVAESVTGSFVDTDKPYVAHGPWLQLLLNEETANLLLEKLQPLATNPEQLVLPRTFTWPDKKLSITILPDNAAEKEPIFNIDS